MNLIQRTAVKVLKQLLPPVLDRGGWFPIVRESYPGAWQQNVDVDFNTLLSNPTIFACITLITSDIAKMRVKLVQQTDQGIWEEFESAAFSPVLRKPNPIQNRIQFWENWMMSKLTRGNTYALKGRDGRNIVTRLFVLDPLRVEPLVAPDGAVFYALKSDNIVGLEEGRVVVPAREIIHDRMNCIFHPLVGTSPLFAGSLAAVQGLNIQTNSVALFANRSQPGGLLVAPGRLDDSTATRLKDYWDTNFSGITNRGKIAVLGDGLKFQSLSVNAEEAQLIDQLKWTAETICSVFHVPPYKVGVGAMPSYNNVQALNVEYYSQCLQRLIEDAELCLDEGLECPKGTGTEFDLDGLLRMDTLSQIDSIGKAISAGFLAPNEGRKKVDLKPVKGGDQPYLQQQNFSLEALAKRDAKDDPTATVQPGSAITTGPAVSKENEELDGFQIEALLTKGKAEANAAR